MTFHTLLAASVITLLVSLPIAAQAASAEGQSAHTPEHAARADYCAVVTTGSRVEVSRPAAGEPPIDDVNWFARPVPNPRGERIIAFASHNRNYLYNLTTGARVRVPDRSDGVATPDGRYLTVPSHYTATNTINFYDLPTLLARLDAGKDADDVPPVFAHADADVFDVYYQSVGRLADRSSADGATTVYRMMFSGSTKPAPPGFRIVDYTFTRSGDRVTATASKPMRLCPQIVDDMATPFISKDGRYIVAHDRTVAERPSLKIFEIASVDPAARTSACRQVVDLGLVAGKADFSYDNSQLVFHVATYDYITAFVDGGLKAPTMTDVVVVDLERGPEGGIAGYGRMSRVTTTATPGVGHYFPAFFPDGALMYVSNATPKTSDGAKRFSFTVVDPDAERRVASVFATPDSLSRASAIGQLWKSACAAELPAFKPHEAAWYALVLAPAQCRRLVADRMAVADGARTELLTACDALAPASRR